jgi:hypothetical protein
MVARATGSRALAGAGVLLVVAFFGPWLDLLGLVRASGWALAREESLGGQRHLLWLAPAGGALLAGLALRGRREARAAALAVGLFVVGLAVYQVLDGLVESLRYGAWLTILGAVAVIVGAASPRHRGAVMVAGVAVIAGFFLPWLGQGRLALSGFDLARLEGAAGLLAPSWLFAIPVLGAAATLAALAERTRRISLLAGAGVLAYLYVASLNLFLGWGAWLTLAAAAAAALLAAPRR